MRPSTLNSSQKRHRKGPPTSTLPSPLRPGAKRLADASSTGNRSARAVDAATTTTPGRDAAADAPGVQMLHPGAPSGPLPARQRPWGTGASTSRTPLEAHDAPRSRTSGREEAPSEGHTRATEVRVVKSGTVPPATATSCVRRVEVQSAEAEVPQR